MSIGKEAALLFAVLFLPGMVAQGVRVDPSSFESIYYNLQVLVIAIPQLLLVLYVSELSSPGYRKVLGWTRPRLRDLAVAAPTLLILWVTLAGVAAAGQALAPVIEGEMRWRFSAYALTPLVLITSIAVGYREEVFFRAYLLNRASEAGLNATVSVVLAALLFALGHLYQGIDAFLGTFSIGVIVGFVYLRYRSLHAVAWAHGIYNTVALLLSGTLLPA